MFTHEQIWTAIDQLAKNRGYSASGLARQAGLDPTSFNRSKRISPSGKPRWPSTESIAKILAVTECNTVDFLLLGGIEASAASTGHKTQNTETTDVPFIDLATLSGGRNPISRDGTDPQKQRKPAPPILNAAAAHYDGACFATLIDDNRFDPLFRRGTAILIAPQSPISPITTGDRVLAFSRNDGLVAGIVSNDTTTLTLTGVSTGIKTISSTDIAWIGRVILATQ